MTQPLPTPNRHFKHIAHKDGRLEPTDQIEVTIDYPITRGAVVDYKATALSLARQLSDEREDHKETDVLLRIAQRQCAANVALLNDQRRYLAVTYKDIHAKWYWNFLPSAVRAALTL